MEVIVFLGIQGSGKGTQAKLLSDRLQYQHINIGDLFRTHIKGETAIGIEVNEIIKAGELVGDDIVFQMINESCSTAAKGIIFDGFPRTMKQAEYLLQHFDVKRVYYLNLSEAEAINRISGRLICSHCGADYNINSSPPQLANICDKCGSALKVRQDDKPNAIRKRMKEFYRQTYLLKDIFQSHSLLCEINADKEVTEVYKSILDDLHEYIGT